MKMRVIGKRHEQTFVAEGTIQHELRLRSKELSAGQSELFDHVLGLNVIGN
jgi:hypothetical protein